MPDAAAAGGALATRSRRYRTSRADTASSAAVRGTGDGGVGIVKRINDDGTLEARARRPTGPQREKASPRVVAEGFA